MNFAVDLINLTGMFATSCINDYRMKGKIDYN